MLEGGSVRSRPLALPPAPMQIKCNIQEDPNRELNPVSTAREHGRSTGTLETGLQGGAGKTTGENSLLLGLYGGQSLGR